MHDHSKFKFEVTFHDEALNVIFMPQQPNPSLSLFGFYIHNYRPVYFIDNLHVCERKKHEPKLSDWVEIQHDDPSQSSVCFTGVSK